VLREYQLLAEILVDFVQHEIERLSPQPTPLETSEVVSRLHRAAAVLMQSTVETFVALYSKTTTEQSERLEEFARMATHEWRQPLGTLQFAVTLLRHHDPLPAHDQKVLDSMERSVLHLIELTRKIEALARLGASTDDPVVQTISAEVIAREAARQLAEPAAERSVEIRVADNLPTLNVDTGRLELVLLNLLSNAIKYCDASKPERFVEITGDTHHGQCRLIVRDNGLGIPADRVATVFERFTRAHASRDESLNVTGMGLGLAIVADCVHAMGGQVAVQSEEKRGTTFVLTLPVDHPH
jgi:signal transduction histidine kinase